MYKFKSKNGVIGLSRHKDGNDLPDFIQPDRTSDEKTFLQPPCYDTSRPEAWVAKLLHELTIEEGLDVSLVLKFLEIRSKPQGK